MTTPTIQDWPMNSRREIIRCQRHDNFSALKVAWQKIAHGRQQIRVDCVQCGRYICYAPATPVNIELANNKTTVQPV